MDVPVLPSSSRILYDVPCTVCRDHSSGKHYGVYACDGCAGFFKRSVRRQRRYECKARSPGLCLVDKTHRNQCRACRLDKCLDVGMNRDAVQHERGPRMSTISRQMALFVNDRPSSNDMAFPAQPVPELVPKRPMQPPPLPLALHPFPPPFSPFLFNRMGLLRPPVIPLPPSLSFLPMMSGMVLANDPGATCEVAAKLLFMNVKWAKGITAFENLTMESQLYLLGETWKDLFVLGAGQFVHPLDLTTFINQRSIIIDMASVDLLQVAIAEIGKFCPDTVEYTCLRGMLLFKKNQSDRTEDDSLTQTVTESRRLTDWHKVVAEHDRNKEILNQYAAISHPLETSRSNRLQQLLPIISRVSSRTIVDLFFRATIGDISIERIICDMYRTA